MLASGITACCFEIDSGSALSGRPVTRCFHQGATDAAAPRAITDVQVIKYKIVDQLYRAKCRVELRKALYAGVRFGYKNNRTAEFQIRVEPGSCCDLIRSSFIKLSILVEQLDQRVEVIDGGDSAMTG